MDEILTMAEIEARYDGEWVLLTDLVRGENRQLIGGRIVFHSKNRSEVGRKGVELRLPSTAYRYIGNPPEGMAYAL